jgi:exopolysaccharide biosynthesis WecB/TagA/CpsF family protein
MALFQGSYMPIATQRLQPLATVDGWTINIADQGQAIAEIVGAAARGENFSVFTLNLDHLYKLKRQPLFRAAYASARFVTADGAPVAFLASLKGVRVERTTGSDLVVPLSRAAAENRLPLYLFGTNADILERAARFLKQSVGPDLLIVGSSSPERDFDPDGAAADAAIDAIARSGARLCFVALGAPKQELFAAKAVARGGETGFVCIGAGLDFLVGAQSRAPLVMQKCGMEWLWRLLRDPRRLAPRYARCAIALGDLALIAPAKQLISSIFS